MNKFLKQIICMIFCICIMFISTGKAFAWTITMTNGDYTFEVDFNSNEAKITDVNRNIRGDITIPLKLGDYTVTAIGNSAFYLCTGITSVMILDNVKEIGSNAFKYCTNISEVTIPESINTIESGTFYWCTNLKKITIPDKVTNIGDSAFYKCESLTELNYTGTEEDWEKVIIGKNNEYLKNAYNYTFADSEIISVSATVDSLTVTSQANIFGNPNITTFGIVFIPLSLYEADIDDVANVEYDNSFYDIKDGQKFMATLKNIPSGYEDMNIVFLSYIVTDNEIYEYSLSSCSTVNRVLNKSE